MIKIDVLEADYMIRKPRIIGTTLLVPDKMFMIAKEYLQNSDGILDLAEFIKYANSFRRPGKDE